MVLVSLPPHNFVRPPLRYFLDSQDENVTIFIQRKL